MPRASSMVLVSLIASTLTACECGGDGTESVEIASCSTHDPALEEPRTIGAATLTPDDRRLVITGLPETSRWVVGRGAALSIEPFLPTLDAIEALEPHGVIVLGSFGTGERLEELVTALGELTVGGAPVPILLVPGPRDHLASLDEALAAHPQPHVISLAGTHVVEIGRVALLVASGSVEARYVLEGACHVEDLDEVLGASDPEHVRVVLGFDAPAGSPLTRGVDGAEAGSERMRAALEEAGIVAGIFAGPDTQVGRWVAGDAAVLGVGLDRRVIVAPLAGPAVDCADGSRAPSGPTLVALGPSGLGPVESR
ncbi:MAG: hypothetical protein J0L92_37735 [Deltaproteobacteria bacterium]|nr:hypothetical protein [Deltaproteobacteria bacterium]